MVPSHFQEVVHFPSVPEIAIPAAEVIPKCIFVLIQYPSCPPGPSGCCRVLHSEWAEAGWVLQSRLVKALIVMEKGGGVLQFNAGKGGWNVVVQEK